jgi:exoribonuclease R
MATYKLTVSDRGYEGYSYTRTDTGEAGQVGVDPYEARLFDGDVVAVSDGSLISSRVRDGEELVGVLVLDDKCKYGKQKDKFLYKCIPDRPGLPFFLLPRKEPKVSFSTKRENIFVVFRFAEWGAGRSFPIGTVVRTIGLVSESESFYEYQVVRRGLHLSMGTLARKAVSAVKAGITVPVASDDRTDRRVFTIDPEGCRDFDDAVGIQTMDDGFLISVYIANVPSCLEKLKLWDVLSDRVATIYMPDRKWPMLPPVLSESLCSLVSGSERDVLAMDVALDRDMIPIRFSFSSTRISVSDNFVYESPALAADQRYELLHRVIPALTTAMTLSRD